MDDIGGSLEKRKYTKARSSANIRDAIPAFTVKRVKFCNHAA